ncbi:MAG: tRNA (adenosine(37)-N6)-threonylcarbamoyltransferase complex ATPase subunit type 1 TsaE [Alphaproteobacteria bacterium]
MEILSRSEEDTGKAARAFAVRLQAPQVILLQGPLGSGKSVFARALIRALTGNAHEEVPSPTFTLAQTYETAKGPLWHFDLYRLKTPKEVYELGWEEALADIVLIEWPERLGALMPANCMRIEFKNDPQNPCHRLLHMSGAI